MSLRRNNTAQQSTATININASVSGASTINANALPFATASADSKLTSSFGRGAAGGSDSASSFDAAGDSTYLCDTSGSATDACGLTPSQQEELAAVPPSKKESKPSHACVSIGGSVVTKVALEGCDACDSTKGTPNIAFTETDGVHTQHLVLRGNALCLGGETASDEANGTTVSLHGEAAGNNGSDQERPRMSGPTLWRRLYLSLMPEGYPHSVTPDYLRHQIWDALNFASYNVMATLATRAMLKGVGVGSGESTVLSGTLVWLLKDISALLSSIGVAVKLANDLDNDAKQWRMFADITTDIGLLLEVYSEHLPQGFFIAVICIASMFRSVWTVAGWSSRVALTQHFAIRNNMADVSARNGAQETLFTLLGMLGGMYMAYAISASSTAAQALYFIGGTLIHLYFNYKSVKSLILTHFNKHRALICVNRFLATRGQSVFSPDEGNDLEPVMWWREPFQITFGVRPSEVKISRTKENRIRTLTRILQRRKKQIKRVVNRLKALIVAAVRTTPLSLRRHLRRLWPRKSWKDGDGGEVKEEENVGDASVEGDADAWCGGVTPKLLSSAIRHVLSAPEGRRFALIATVPRPSRWQAVVVTLATRTLRLFRVVVHEDDRRGGGGAEMSASRGMRVLRWLGSGGRIQFSVLLREGAGDEESLWAFYCACKAAAATKGMLSPLSLTATTEAVANLFPPPLSVGAHLIIASDDDGYAQFKAAAISAGWDMSKVQFRVFDWRVREGDEGENKKQEDLTK